jgi:hypothetical protein
MRIKALQAGALLRAERAMADYRKRVQNVERSAR